MEIYVLKDGRRVGPFPPFKLRELLEDKEIQPSYPGWIEGMETWAPLKSIEALESWMPRDPALPPPLPHSQDSKQGDADSPADLQEIQTRRVRAWLRWLARTIDEMLWFTLIWVVAVSTGWLQLWDYLLRGPLLLIGSALLWIPVESLVLSRFSTTPGKWLLGIRVTDDLGQLLTYPAALKRTALAVCTGAGLGLPALMLLPVLQGTMSWLLYRRTGTTLWDRAADSQLIHTRPTPAGFISIGVIVAGWFALCIWIAVAIPLPPDTPPELRQKLEELHQQFDRANLIDRSQANLPEHLGNKG